MAPTVINPESDTDQPRLPHPERATLTVEEVGRLLGLGRNPTYDAVRRGEIPSLRVGRRILIPRAAFDRWLAGE